MYAGIGIIVWARLLAHNLWSLLPVVSDSFLSYNFTIFLHSLICRTIQALLPRIEPLQSFLYPVTSMNNQIFKCHTRWLVEIITQERRRFDLTWRLAFKDLKKVYVKNKYELKKELLFRRMLLCSRGKERLRRTLSNWSSRPAKQNQAPCRASILPLLGVFSVADVAVTRGFSIAFSSNYRFSRSLVTGCMDLIISEKEVLLCQWVAVDLATVSLGVTTTT